MNSAQIINLFSKYKCIFYAAKKLVKYGTAMGGIILYIRKECINYFSEIDISCDFAIFIKCNKILFGLDEDTLRIFTYLPPDGSSFL